MELLLSEWRFGVYRSIVMSYQLPLEPVQGISVERRRAVNRLQKTLCPPKCYDDTTQSPRFLSHDRTFTVVALSYQGQSVVLLGEKQKFGRSFPYFDNKQAPPILQHIVSTIE